MKKFITTIPLQEPERLAKNKYEAADNPKLAYDKAISFPILAIMNGYLEEGEDVEVLAIKQKYPYADQNYLRFQEELRELEAEKGCQCRIRLIETEYSDATAEHLRAFGKLIEYVGEGDDMYACMTYGSKPVPIIQIMAINYAYRARNQTSVGCIAYGQRDHKGDTMKIYDMTNLFMMDEIVRKVADMKLENPLKFIQAVLEQ